MWQFFSHIWWFLYFFLTFDGSIIILCNSNITCDRSFLTFGGSLTFFLTFDGFILTLCSFNITCDGFFSHIWWLPYLFFFFFFFFTFDGSILTLCGSNITCDCSFLVLGGFITFFSYLTVPSSHCAVSTSYVTILLSHLVVLLLFSYIWWFHCHIK